MINEDHKEIASGKKKDDEGYMARVELDSIERSLKNLKKSIKSSDQQLPAWVQSKITRAADYIDTAAEYLQSDEKVEESRQISFPVKKSSGAGALTPDAAKQLGSKAVELQKKKAAQVSLPTLKKENTSLVDTILQEIEEEINPKGPKKPHKSIGEIAKKHNTSVEHIKKQLKIGIKIESEHTSSESEARGIALQHLEERPNYYSELKKMESQKESVSIEDANGNPYVEFIDLIKPDPMKSTAVDESIRLQSQSGNLLLVMISWRGKYLSVQMFFPQAKMPNRQEITIEVQKVYPDCRVLSYKASSLVGGGTPIIQVVNSQSKNYLLNNKTIGEESSVLEAAAWTKKSGKDPEGGLNEKGRKSYERENPGSDLKRPQPKGGPRRDSFCARMKGMKNKLTSAKTANDPDSRINKSLRAWNC